MTRLATWLAPLAQIHGISGPRKYAIAVILLAHAVVTPGLSTAAPTATAALALKPVQSEVPYEKVSGNDIAKCQVRDIERDDWSGWEVFAADGTLLRRFADTNGDKKVDLWCYFQYGLETYRDVDSNFNGKADQYRWMATAGMKWGLDRDEDGRIDQWKMISAEEVTQELVNAIRDADPERFASLLASPRELQSIGVEGERLKTLSDRTSRAASGFKRFADSQTAIAPATRWIQFAASAPGIITADAEDLTRDVIAYENAVAMFETEGESGQMMVGTLVRIGDTWKLVELPVLSEPGDPIAQTSGTFFTPGEMAAANMAGAGGDLAKTQEMVDLLEKIDSQLSQAQKASDIARLNASRADVVERLITAADSADKRDLWIRQLVDTVSVAVQSNQYPAGLDRLKSFAAKLGRNDQALRAYTEFTIIGTEYVARNTSEKDFAKTQEWWLTSLNDFADRFPDALETAQAKLQLALSKEFEDKESEALKLYRDVATQFPGTEAAKKAAGAARRLDSIGKVVDLQGATLDGKAFKLSALRGRPVVLHYWATWCEPCKQDMKLLKVLQTRYKRTGIQIIGVNIDSSRNSVRDFLRSSPLPWVQLFEEGGLEASPLALQFGVQTLPTIMLVDQRGRMVQHNVRAAELDDEIGKLVSTKRR
ncbi:MAG: TlpA disulfide reductase family protein [Planctomycetota bacterium]